MTLFCLSFTTTAFIIINANRLTYDTGKDSELKKQIAELEAELEEKNAEIERLTVSSSAPSFSAPVINTVIPKTNAPKKEAVKSEETQKNEKSQKNEKAEETEEAPQPTEENVEPITETESAETDIISELEGILN